MDLVVRQGKREEKVQVRRVDGGYEVTLGERTYHVDSLPARAGLHSLRIEGSHHEVAIRNQGEGTYWVSTAQGAGPVEVVDPLTYLANQALGAKGGKRRKRVDAYMPGRVVAVLVQEGEAVTAGHGIIVLEAMKMENELAAERGGTVSAIHKAAGQAVDTGDLLVEIT